MLKPGDKVYFIKKNKYNTELPYNELFTIFDTLDSKNDEELGTIVIIEIQGRVYWERYLSSQFISISELRREKLKKLTTI